MTTPNAALGEGFDPGRDCLTGRGVCEKATYSSLGGPCKDLCDVIRIEDEFVLMGIATRTVESESVATQAVPATDFDMIAEQLTGQMFTTVGCPDEVEERAAARSGQQILEVLRLLGGVEVLSGGQKESAALNMGQRIFDALCAPLADGTYSVDMENYPLDREDGR